MSAVVNKLSINMLFTFKNNQSRPLESPFYLRGNSPVAP